LAIATNGRFAAGPQQGGKQASAIRATRAGDAALSANHPKAGEASSLQMFTSVHASLRNHFASDRLLTDRQTYKTNRSAALAEWQSLID
jgi:hypothetical protein